MINMPIPCNIVANYSSDVAVSLLTSGANAIAEDTLSLYPDNLAEVREVIWVNLTYAQVQEVEASLMQSKATERFLWEGFHYHLEDGYTVEVSANRPVIKASFRRVG